MIRLYAGTGRQRLVAALLAVASLVYLWFALDLSWGRWSRPGSGFFPRISAGLALLLATGAALLTRTPSVPPAGDASKPLILTGLLILFTVALQPLGFIVCGSVFTACLAWQLGARRVSQVAAVALPLPWVLHYVFLTAFEIRLPAGLLAPWLGPPG